MVPPDDENSSGDDWGAKAGGETKSLPAHIGDDTAVMVTDAAGKSTIEVITLRQQVEHLLDYMGTYTREDLLKLCHAYMLKHPAAQVLVEYGVMSIANCNRFGVVDTQNSLLF